MMPLNRVRWLAKIKSGEAKWNSRSRGPGVLMLEWFARHGLVLLRDDENDWRTGFTITEKGLADLQKAVLEHSDKGNFRPK